MKKDKVFEYTFAVMLCAILLSNFLVLNIFDNRFLMAIFLGVYVIICSFFVKSKRVDNVNKKFVIFLMIVFAVVYILSLYVMGIFLGFYKNAIRFSFKVLYNRILPYSAIIIFSEIIRKIFITKDDKKSTIIITLSLILVDLITFGDFSTLNNLESLLTLIGYIGMSSISVNLMCNYIVKRYGYLPNIFYRLLTIMYMYVFPILPDVYIFFQTTLRILYPYFIYLIIDNFYDKDKYKTSLKTEKISFFRFSNKFNIYYLFSIISIM